MSASVFSRSAFAHGTAASSSSVEGDREYTLADGERADEGRPQFHPPTPFCLCGVKISAAGARRGAALPRLKEGAKGNDL